MLELEDNALRFRFPEVHPDAACRVDFQRTLRIPDDNRAHPLPAGLARFPLEHVDDHADRLPADWRRHGGVLLPMYQAEALWLAFHSPLGYPCALKVAAGKIDAITGADWSERLSTAPQDYLVLPDQPWLDGFCVGTGLVRQFVSMPLGAGYTAEEQISGAAEHGGLQLVCYPMRRERYERLRAELCEARLEFRSGIEFCVSEQAMGLAPGGLMRQQVFADEHGVDAWDVSAGSRCFVHILNSTQWQAATGRPAPGRPPTAKEYARAGLPWFEYYEERAAALPGDPRLTQLDSLAARELKAGTPPPDAAAQPAPAPLVQLGRRLRRIAEGRW